MPMKKERKKKSTILMLLILIAVTFFAIVLITLQFKANAKQDELDEHVAQYEQVKQKNEGLANDLENINDEEGKREYIERIAREQLDYAKPDERVYYNVTPGE